MNDPVGSIGSNVLKTQMIAIVVSVVLFLYIFYLVRKKKIKEEYSLLWLFSSIIFIAFSIWRDGLEYFARLVGIAYPPAALFLILMLAIFLILIEFSVIISKLSEESKILAQEIALMKFRIEQSEAAKKPDKTISGDDFHNVEPVDEPV